MDIKSVPQDNSSTYSNNKKAIYAVDEDGRVKVVPSSGWEAEEIATKQVLEDLKRYEQEAYAEVKNAQKSPLYFYMYSVRMDLQVLSESTGFFKWTIKRHFKPKIFNKLSDKTLSIYADALGKNIEELKILPENHYE